MRLLSAVATADHGWPFASASVNAAHVRDALRHRGVAAEAASGETPTSERAEIFERFRAGDIRCLTGVNVFATGRRGTSRDRLGANSGDNFPRPTRCARPSIGGPTVLVLHHALAGLTLALAAMRAAPPGALHQPGRGARCRGLRRAFATVGLPDQRSPPGRIRVQMRDVSRHKSMDVLQSYIRDFDVFRVTQRRDHFDLRGNTTTLAKDLCRATRPADFCSSTKAFCPSRGTWSICRLASVCSSTAKSTGATTVRPARRWPRPIGISGLLRHSFAKQLQQVCAVPVEGEWNVLAPRINSRSRCLEPINSLRSLGPRNDVRPQSEEFEDAEVVCLDCSVDRVDRIACSRRDMSRPCWP